MNVSIVFRTKYEGNLKATARILDGKISTIIPKLPVGYTFFIWRVWRNLWFLHGVARIHNRRTRPDSGPSAGVFKVATFN